MMKFVQNEGREGTTTNHHFFLIVQLAMFLLLQQLPWAITSTYCATNQQPPLA